MQRRSKGLVGWVGMVSMLTATPFTGFLTGQSFATRDLDNKMRELGSVASEVNQLRIHVMDLLNKVKST